MVACVRETRFFLKHQHWVLENLRNKAKNIQYIRRNKARLLGISLISLQEKLVVLILL